MKEQYSNSEPEVASVFCSWKQLQNSVPSASKQQAISYTTSKQNKHSITHMASQRGWLDWVSSATEFEVNLNSKLNSSLSCPYTKHRKYTLTASGIHDMTCMPIVYRH